MSDGPEKPVLHTQAVFAEFGTELAAQAVHEAVPTRRFEKDVDEQAAQS